MYFNTFWASVTVILCLVMIAGGIAYIAAKPSFGGYFDCAWDYETGTASDCHTPGASWWAWAAIPAMVVAMILIVAVVTQYWLRKNHTTLVDVIYWGIAAIAGIAAGIVGVYFICKCIKYPSRIVGTSCCDLDHPKYFPCCKMCCWTLTGWVIPAAIATFVCSRLGDRVYYPPWCPGCTKHREIDV